jgi:hypothetical protein
MRTYVAIYDLVLLAILLLLALTIFIGLRPNQGYELSLARLESYVVYDSLVQQIFYRPVDYIIATKHSTVNLKDSGLTFPLLAAWICYNVSSINISYNGFSKTVSLFARKYFAEEFVKQLLIEYQPYLTYLEVDIACDDRTPVRIYSGEARQSSLCISKSFNTSYNLTLTVIACR